MILLYIKDTHSENKPSNKTQMLVKSMNLEIWSISTLNKLFMWGSYTQIKFLRKGSN